MTPENIEKTKDLVPGVYAAVGKLIKVEGQPGEVDSS